MLQFNFKIAKKRGFSKHSSWLSLATRIESHLEDTFIDQRRCTDNAHWSYNFLLRCCIWGAIFLRTRRWWRWDWIANPWKEGAVWEKDNRMASAWGTILNEPKYKRIYKDWRKHYVVLHTRNQGKCADTSKTRCWSSLEKLKTENTGPAIWWTAINNRQTI